MFIFSLIKPNFPPWNVLDSKILLYYKYGSFFEVLRGNDLSIHRNTFPIIYFKTQMGHAFTNASDFCPFLDYIHQVIFDAESLFRQQNSYNGL